MRDELKKLYRLHLANKAVLLSDRERLLAQQRAVTDAHHRHLHPEYTSPEDEMISLGDHSEVHHHYPTAPQDPGVPKPSPIRSGLRKAIVSLGLLGLGGGLTTGGFLLSQFLKPPAPEAKPVVTPVPEYDDTMHELHLLPSR